VDMQNYHRMHVQLSQRDRKRVAEMLNKGHESARVLTIPSRWASDSGTIRRSLLCLKSRSFSAECIST